jgi:O-methyltransferase involved in polyketide biosynthesis
MTETSSPITPTAHYTAAVWARNGLSHPALSTTAGRLMFESTRPTMALFKALGGNRLEDHLLARHRLIDRLLEAAIERGEVAQVIEIAAGLSPRGWRFTRRHGDSLTYIETDLPEMAERKRRALIETGSLGPRHRVIPLDALTDDGRLSLDAVAAGLDRTEGLAIITEGLLTYLNRDSTLGLWRRAARALSSFPDGLMLSDLHLASENTGALVSLGSTLLSLFVRGHVEMQFEDEDDALGALEGSGFPNTVLHRGSEASDVPGTESVRVIEARTQ